MVVGIYFDPWHGGCLRRIVQDDAANYRIHGVYGNDDSIEVSKDVEYDRESSRCTGQYWTATCVVQNKKNHLTTLTVDFSEKPNKKRLIYKATYDAEKRVIVWDDGNTWKQLYYHSNQLGCDNVIVIWFAEEAARKLKNVWS